MGVFSKSVTCGGRHTFEILFRGDVGSVARRRCVQSSPVIVSPRRPAERGQPSPFPIQIVPASAMRYRPYLQRVRSTVRKFSRTVVIYYLRPRETDWKAAG